jgi:predicted transcriptional regulator
MGANGETEEIFTVTFRIPVPLLARLDMLAQREGRDRTHEIRRAIAEHVEANE